MENEIHAKSAEERAKNNALRCESIINDNLLNIQQWRIEGYSAEQIAQKLGFAHRSVLYLLMRRMKALKEAWRGADTAILEEFIEPQLKKRAEKGFAYVEEVEELLRDSEGYPIKDEEGKLQYIVTKKIKKVAPCTNTLHFMAKQLDKERWGNKQEDVDPHNDLEVVDELKEE